MDYSKLTFQEIRALYINKRKQEQNKLYSFLKSEFNIVNKGCGRKNYTSQGRLNKSYDLSNHLWIEVNKKIIISFQPLEQDKNTGNFHSLEDRIGIYRESSWEYLDIDLPLSNTDMQTIRNLLIRNCSQKWVDMVSNGLE